MTAVLRAFPGHLLAPLQIGPVELANRIVSTAHQTTLVHEHLPTEDFVAYHEARARETPTTAIPRFPLPNAGWP